MPAGAYVGLVVCSGDNGFLNTSVIDNVSASFLPTNSGPVLGAIPNHAVNVGQTVAANASAVDSASPSPVLTFSLLNAPANATLLKNNSNNAVLNWRPLVSDANTTNIIKLKVADNAVPSLSATQSVQIVVNPLTLPTLASSHLSNGQFSLSVTSQVGPDYALQASSNLIDWTTVWTTNSPAMPFSWSDTNTGVYPERFYRLQVGPPFP
jgi:hypothetical protein